MVTLLILTHDHDRYCTAPTCISPHAKFLTKRYINKSKQKGCFGETSATGNERFRSCWGNNGTYSVREYMEWENEECDEHKHNCLMLHGKRVSSLFKVIIDKSCLQVLEIHLENSSVQRWRVTVCNHNGSLAILQGWPKFSSEHGLNVGDFLVFHYIQGWHFIVQIFGTSACEKIKFCSDISKGKKRARTYPEATSPRKLLQTTDINSVKKKNKTSAASESEKVTDKPNTTKSATNIDADTGKGSTVHSAIYVDESFCMIDRDAQFDQGDNRLCLHLSSFEMPASKPLAEGTNSLLKVDNGNSNHVETNLRSQTVSHLDVEIDYLNSEALLPKFEAGIMGTDMASRPAEEIPPLDPRVEKSKEASQFAREAILVKKEFEETAAEAFCPVRQISGDASANGNEKFIKSEPADSGDTPFLNAVSYSLQLEVDGRDFLELPESWRKLLMKKRHGWRIIFLQGPDKRTWPTVYHCRPGFDVLTSGWKLVTAFYGLNSGDECLFQLVSQQECIFDVRKI